MPRTIAMPDVECETVRIPILERILARSFGQQHGQLQIGKLPIGELVERHGTPLFLYDDKLINRQWEQLRSSLPDSVSIYYSIKANPAEPILRRICSLGAGLEVASAGELQRARNSGCSIEQIIFAGPGKSDEELRLALSTGIGAIHAESIHELKRISSIAKTIGCRAPVALRVNPIDVAQGGAMRMGGKASPFGIDEEQLDAAVELVTDTATFDWKGLHFYNGTQILDAKILRRQYGHGVEVAIRVAEKTQRPIPTLDFGGGFGVAYFDHEPDLDLSAFSDAAEEVISAAKRHWALQETRFIIEPGRFLVAEAGVYVTRVVDVKQSRGKWFVVVDGGMHHHLAASGNLGQTIKRNFPIAVVNKLNEPLRESMDIVGCLCTPLDTLGRNIQLPRVVPGDLIGVFQSGAYALSASPQGFLSHPAPAEIWVTNSESHAIRS